MQKSKRWRSKIIYVDIETGELIEEKKLNNYIIIKVNKHTTYNEKSGTIEYTKQCRRGQYREQELPFNDK